MTTQTMEKRRCDRSIFPYYVEYVLHPSTSDETYYGAIMNISDAGLCLCGSAPLTEGQEIMIKSDLTRLCRVATVRWVEHLDNMMCKAGISFK